MLYSTVANSGFVISMNHGINLHGNFPPVNYNFHLKFFKQSAMQSVDRYRLPE